MNNSNTGLNNKILLRMQMLCSRQERCTSDIRRKLIEYNISIQEINRIINILLKENYINDERYAIAFANDKFRFNKWGKKKIEYHLRHKGIDNDIIFKALEDIDIEEYLNMIKSELTRKFKNDKSSNIYVLKSRLMRFGQSKGFETELLFNIINEILHSGG